MNFWAIVLYNILALNSLEFALLVTKRLLVMGKVLPALRDPCPNGGDTGTAAED